jgi:two-component system, cell cycle sensor histidine kinase and response regulator CckA
MSGYSAAELTSFGDLWGLAAPEDQASVRERATTRLRGETVPDDYEFRIVTKKGQTRWMSSTASRIIYSGKPAIVAMIFDISERKRFEQELRASEERFRQLFERNLAGVFRCTLNGRFLDCNDSFATIFGFKNRQEVLKQSAWNFSASDETRESFISRLTRDRVLTNIEEPIRRADGELIWVLENVALLDGEIAGETVIEGTVIDITERKRADAELRASEEKYRRLFERNLAGVYVSTLDGKLLDCNESLAHIYGYLSREELLSVDARELYMTSGDRDSFIRGLRQRRVYTNLESKCRRKDGSAFWVLENVALLSGANGEPDRIQGTMIDITERKLAEQALVESESKFRAVADTAASAIYIHDGNSFLYSNRASEVISGYSAEELKQLRAYDLVHPDDRQMTIDRGIARQRGEKVPSRYEYRIVAKDGTVKWLDFSASPVRFEGRDAILATAFDITERKRVERIQAALYQIAERANAAEELEYFFRGIHGIISDLMYARNLYIALYQREAQQLSYPYYVDEKDEPPVGSYPLGKGLTEYVLRHGQAVLITPERSNELAAADEIELVGSDCVDWLGAPLKSGNHVFGVIAVQSYSEAVRYNDHDREVLNFVSQHLANAIIRKRNEEALRESEQRYRSLVQSAVYGIYRSGVKDHFLDVNPAMVRLLGYDTEQEVLNLSLKNDVYVDSEERTDLINKHMDGEGRIEDVEVRWKRKDQRVSTVRLSGRAVKKPNGEFDSFEMIAEDVTERRNLEDQLRQSQKMEAVGRLAGGVAHDFNNLLTVIKGYTELMLEEFREHDPMRGELEEIRKAADRASALTRQLLAFSRQQVLAPKVLDVNVVVTNMDKLLRRLLGADVELTANLDATIGRIKADPGQLEQVIMNLAVNARDAMPVGGKLLIETRNVELDETFARDHVGSKPGAYVMLAVTDNGMGMNETVRQRIFEPFFTTKEAGKGTGLGLSTVYGIIKQSGGYIWVYSEVGKGSTFKVYLSRVDAKVDTSLPDVLAPQSAFGRETVLLVEDEDGVRALVRQVLHKHGYSVLEARHGGEALLHCERHKNDIDLLLTDVVLEQMTGPELAKRLTVLRPEMKVLYISGYTDDAVIHHGVSTGTAFLQKPFTTDALAKKVREVLDRVPQV